MSTPTSVLNSSKCNHFLSADSFCLILLKEIQKRNRRKENSDKIQVKTLVLERKAKKNWTDELDELRWEFIKKKDFKTCLVDSVFEILVSYFCPDR